MAVGGGALIAMLVVLGLLDNAAAYTYTVGSASSNGGWTYVTGNETTYDDQFKSLDVFVGDSLYFEFPIGTHTVVEVPSGDVVICDSSNAISPIYTSTNITLQNAGDHGFICTIPDHCRNFGMRLSLTVHETGARPPEALAPKSGGNDDSLLRSGPAIIVGALLAACALAL